MSTHFPLITRKLSLLFLLTLIVLSGCSPEETNSSNKQPTSNVISLTPELNTIFQQTCANCHLKANTGAPQSGDHKAWEKILSKGLNETLERAINGYGGMPPAGQCFECTPEQLSTLIRYMSSSD